MQADHFKSSIFLPDPSATEGVAKRIAPLLNSGDVVLLAGEIGAGKTHFARALIQSRLATAEDVPSPTYTLVQVYDADEIEIWHADLYRLSGPDEVIELGLSDAFETALCLVEWPDRLEELTPAGALSLLFEPGDEGRQLTLSGPARWSSVIEAALDE